MNCVEVRCEKQNIYICCDLPKKLKDKRSGKFSERWQENEKEEEKLGKCGLLWFSAAALSVCDCQSNLLKIAFHL